MTDFLVADAIKRVWCAPDQDNLIVLNPKRISPKSGFMVTANILTRNVALPNKKGRFHIYYVGRAFPALLGLVPPKPEWAEAKWVGFSEALRNLPLFINVCNVQGITSPLFNAYYLYTEEGALVFAIEIDKTNKIDYDTEELLFKFYTNAFYSSGRSAALTTYTTCNGTKVINNVQINQIQNEVANLRLKPGYVFCYVNGMLVSDINVGTAKPGDLIEYVYDASVRECVDLPVKDLHTFNSTLDQKLKYLIHWENTSPSNTINFHDDIEIYVTRMKENGNFNGCHYHRALAKSHRMVTHRDYSILVDQVVNAINYLTGRYGSYPGDPLTGFNVKVIVRNSGLQRPLIFDNNRIFELYKLPESKFIKTLVGSDANVSVWTADSLESSAYTKLMQVNREKINIGLVEDAYGYNAMSVLYGSTPTKTYLDNGNQIGQLPVGLAQKSTVYDYDASGKLIKVDLHNFGNTHRSEHPDTVMFEALGGTGKYRSNAVFGEDNLPIPRFRDYRVYMCYKLAGVPSEDWFDITGSEYYKVIDGKLVWQNLAYEQYLMVLTDESFIDYEIDLNAIAGTYYFSFSLEEDRGNGFLERLMTVPRKNLDIFINGRPAIYGLDYQIQFPMIYILNKSFLNQPALTEVQKIRVRWTGFCDSDCVFRMNRDVGFVEHGVLSNNSKFDIRDDKVLRIVVGGSLKHRDDLVFSELHQGVSPVNAQNGLPYEIQEMEVPVQALIDRPVGPYRAQAKAIDKEVSDYLSAQIPQPPRGPVSTIPARWVLVSPFIAHILHDLASGQFDYSKIKVEMSDNEVIDVCKPYEFLLEFDPINPELKFDHRYVVIHPSPDNSPVPLSVSNYRFMARVVQLYAKDLVSLSGYVTIQN